MHRQRRKSKNLVIILALIVACLYVGYSLITSNLQVRTSLDIGKTSFDVHFENVEVDAKSIIETLPIVSDNKTNITMNITLTQPGDSYIVNANIVNAGTLDAVLNSISVGGVPEEYKDYIDYKILYYFDNTEPKANDLLYAGNDEPIYITIKYNYSEESDSSILLNQEISLNLSLDIEYIPKPKEGTFNQRPFNLYKRMSTMASLDNEKSKYVENENGIDFSKISSDTNGKGIYTVSSTINEEYPINYYRGDVNNNLIANNYCWKIVRTTETGGIRIIYNGSPNEDGTCKQYDGTALNNEFNQYSSNEEDNAYVGYKFGETSASSYEDTHKNTNNSKMYESLSDYISEGNEIWGNAYSEKQLYYYESFFRKSVLEYSDFCFDRTISEDNTPIDLSGEFNNLGYGKNNTVYSGYTRASEKFTPTITCSRNDDILTSNVGGLTLDEAMYAGMLWNEANDNCYLKKENTYWLITPIAFDNDAYIAVIDQGTLTYKKANEKNYIYPVVNLNNTTMIYKGDGSLENPYIVHDSAIYKGMGSIAE